MGARAAAEVVSNSSLTTDFVYGVACLSYPLHPPRKTSELRVSPLLHVGVPVLFINGRKDPFCRADLMENTALNRMANDWTMHWVDSADHELKVNGKVNNEIISNMCEWFVQWCQSVFMAERSWQTTVESLLFFFRHRAWKKKNLNATLPFELLTNFFACQRPLLVCLSEWFPCKIIWDN